MMMKSIHNETGEPGEAAHRRPREGVLLDVEMDDDGVVVEIAKMSVMWKFEKVRGDGEDTTRRCKFGERRSCCCC